MPIVISWDVISKFAKEALTKLTNERSHAFYELHKGHDLPGIWPMFYLYPDYSWSVGYEPTGNFISSVMADDYNLDTFIDHIESGLYSSYEIGPRPRYVPPPLPKIERIIHIREEEVDDHVEDVLKHKAEVNIEEVKPKAKRGRKPKTDKTPVEKPKEKSKLKDKTKKKRAKKSKEAW